MKVREYLAATHFYPGMGRMDIKFDWIDNPGEVPNVWKSIHIGEEYINSERISDGVPKEILGCKLMCAYIDICQNMLSLTIEKPKESVEMENTAQMKLPFTDVE